MRGLKCVHKEQGKENILYLKIIIERDGSFVYSSFAPFAKSHLRYKSETFGG